MSGQHRSAARGAGRRVAAALALLAPAACVDAAQGYAVATPAQGFTVPSGPPHPPAAVSVSAASGSALAISWKPPLDDGGVDLLAYKVRGRAVTRMLALSGLWGERWACAHGLRVFLKL